MILKKILLLVTVFLAVNIFPLVAQNIPARPDPPKLVNDLAGLLSADEVNALENKLVAIDDSTSTQIVVAIVKDLDGADPNQFAYQIGQTWGVGQKGKNNGVVILIKPKTSDSRGQISIQNGYGMEAVMTDALSKRIIENEVIPHFKENNYLQGIDAAVNAVVLASKGMYKGEGKSKNKKSGSGVAIFIILGIIILFMIIAGKNGKSKHHTMGGNSNLPFWLLMGGILGSSGRSSGSGWGDFSSGSGGFGGFGGGGFGGGGASGSW